MDLSFWETLYKRHEDRDFFSFFLSLFLTVLSAYNSAWVSIHWIILV